MQHDDWGLLSEVVSLTFQGGQFNPGEFSKADLVKSVATPDVSKGQRGQTTFDIQECPMKAIVAWLLRLGPLKVSPANSAFTYYVVGRHPKWLRQIFGHNRLPLHV